MTQWLLNLLFDRRNMKDTYTDKETFDKCIDVVLKSEGGFQDNPNDPGNYVGEELRGTKYGIAAKFFPEEDIKNLTLERAKELYYIHYWLPMRLGGIKEAELLLHVFDMGINAGTNRSIRILQKLVGAAPDGIIGPMTTGLVNDKAPLVEKFKDARREYYINLAERKPSLKVFLKGWLNRVDRTHF